MTFVDGVCDSHVRLQLSADVVQFECRTVLDWNTRNTSGTASPVMLQPTNGSNIVVHTYRSLAGGYTDTQQ
jgi:hypothetical protein